MDLREAGEGARTGTRRQHEIPLCCGDCLVTLEDFQKVDGTFFSLEYEFVEVLVFEGLKFRGVLEDGLHFC